MLVYRWDLASSPALAGMCIASVFVAVAARLVGPPTRADVLRVGVELYQEGRAQFSFPPLARAAAILARLRGGPGEKVRWASDRTIRIFERSEFCQNSVRIRDNLSESIKHFFSCAAFVKFEE